MVLHCKFKNTSGGKSSCFETNPLLVYVCKYMVMFGPTSKVEKYMSLPEPRDPSSRLMQHMKLVLTSAHKNALVKWKAELASLNKAS